MRLNKYLIVLNVCIVSLVLSGCVSYNLTKPAPIKSEVINIQYTNAELSGMTDLPIGTYRVPNSQVIISGHQKGGAAGLLFGIVGVAVQNAVNSENGKNAIKNSEDVLNINLTSDAKNITGKIITENNFASKFSLNSNSNGQVLSVATAVIITFISDTEVRPYVILKANLTEAKTSKVIWTTRYISSVGKPQALVGSNSLTAEGGLLLKNTLNVELENAIKFMLTDISEPHARDDSRLTMMQSYFPYTRQRIQTVGYTIGEDDKSIAFIPKLGDAMVFSGVNIIDKSNALYRNATKEDSLFKLIKTPIK